ncbi:MAG: hypothetical protein WB562_14535 [Candidatus Sulfotelmatobacter sp.]
MKLTTILAAVLAALALILSGCGTSDSLESVTLSSSAASSGGFFNLAGEGGTLQLKANANYTSGKSVDVTNFVTYTVTPQGADENGAALPPPPNTVTISPTGLMTAVTPFACTWTDDPPGFTPPSWLLTGSYQIVATYRNLDSQPVFVGVGSASGNGPGGTCGPS